MDNHYEVPVSVRGRQSSAWDDLHARFRPLLIFNRMFKDGGRLVRDTIVFCHLPSCICFKCITCQNQEISYLHGLMEDSIINDGVNGVSYPLTVVSARSDLGIAFALDIINHAAHFYTNYIDVPGTTMFRILLPHQSSSQTSRRAWY